MIKTNILNYFFKLAFQNANNYRYKKAIDNINKILFLDKYNIDALSLKGLYYAHLFDKKNSLNCFNILLKIYPKDLTIYFKKGICSLYLEEYELAIECFNKILNNDNNHIPSLSYKGLAYLYLKEYDKSLVYFDKVLDKQKDTNTILRKSRYYSELKLYDDALNCLNKVLYNDPENSLVLGEICMIYLSKEEYHKSLEHVKTILKINPNDLYMEIVYYYILAHLKEFNDSLKGFRKISKKQFDDCVLVKDYYFYYGKSLKLMENYADALTLYDTFLEKYDFFREDIEKEREEVIKLMSK